MQPSRATLPPIQPHTEAKHDILTHHMAAWFPILGRSSGKLQIIDGFSGPGEYQGGELGSPLLALKSIAEHIFWEEFARTGKVVEFLFVDKNPEFIRSLRGRIQSLSWPPNFRIRIECDEFETVMRKSLTKLQNQGKSMPPTLIFIDPFGSSGFSMELWRMLAKQDSVDMLINFNYLDLNRWLLPDSTKHVTPDALYGNSRWKPALKLIDEDQKNFLIERYRHELGETGWRSTDFEMINRQNQTQYYLVFCTKKIRGMEVIKRAMRSVSPDGAFRYMDRSNPAQLRLIGLGVDEDYATELAEYLFNKYRGLQVSKVDIVEQVVGFHPRWINKDLTAALRLMEKQDPSQIIDVIRTDGKPRRKGSFPAESLITFAEYRQESLF